MAHRLAGQQAAARGALDVQWVLLAPQVEQCLSADGCSLHYRRDKPPWRRRGKVCPHVGPAGAAVTPGSAERCSPNGMSLSLRSLCPRSALCTHGGRIQCRRGWSGPQAGCPRGSGAWDIGCAVGGACPPSRAVPIYRRPQLAVGVTSHRGEDKANSVPTWGQQVQQRRRPLSSDGLQTVCRCRWGLCALGLACARAATASDVGEAGVAHWLAALGAAARGTLDELGLELEGEGGFTG